MRAYERLLNYVKVYTQSAEGTGKSPSTDCQWDLARQLVEELTEQAVAALEGFEHPEFHMWLARQLAGRKK